MERAQEGEEVGGGWLSKSACGGDENIQVRLGWVGDRGYLTQREPKKRGSEATMATKHNQGNKAGPQAKPRGGNKATARSQQGNKATATRQQGQQGRPAGRGRRGNKARGTKATGRNPKSASDGKSHVTRIQMKPWPQAEKARF